MVQLESQLASVIHNTTQISLHNDAQAQHNTVLNLRKQLATADQTKEDNPVLNVSIRYGSLERRYEMVQGLYVSAARSYHTAVTHEDIGETLRTMLEL